MRRTISVLAAVGSIGLSSAGAAEAQGVPVSCGCSTDPATNFGPCIGDIMALPADPLIPQRVVGTRSGRPEM